MNLSAGTRTKLLVPFVLALAPACLTSPSSGTPSVDAGGNPAPDSSSPASDASVEGSSADAGSCSAALVCDDFESYVAGSPPGGKWTTTQNGGTIAIDTTRAYSGQKSVKVSAAVSTGFRSVMIALEGQGLLPVGGNTLYGRMMFWLDSSPQTSVHWTFIDGQGLVPDQTYHSIYRYGGQLPVPGDGGAIGSQLMASYDTPDSYSTPPVGPSSDCYLHSSGRVVPVSAWTCVEWEFDGPMNTMHFWMNGTADADLTMDGTGQGCTSQPATFEWLAPSFDRIDVGWESYQADAARNIWIDDVALGTQRLGCPTP